LAGTTRIVARLAGLHGQLPCALVCPRGIPLGGLRLGLERTSRLVRAVSIAPRFLNAQLLEPGPYDGFDAGRGTDGGHEWISGRWLASA
jgi:hypothetical protein